VVRLRQKIAGAANSVKSLFGQGETGQDEAVRKLEALKSRLQEVKELFRNADTTEFVIVTIPTVLAITESGRLAASLKAEGVPVRRLVVNQLLRKGGIELPPARAELEAAAATLAAALEAARSAPGADAAALDAAAAAGAALAASASALAAGVAPDVSFCALKRKDQARALLLVDGDAGLKDLQRIDAPLFDLEIRGVPALSFMASQVWT
jgi:arsenite-transporting ATPase